MSKSPTTTGPRIPSAPPRADAVEPRHSATSGRQAILELTGIWLLIELLVWVPRSAGTAAGSWRTISAVFLVGLTLRSVLRRRAWLLPSPSMQPYKAWAWASVLTLCAVLVMIAVASWAGILLHDFGPDFAIRATRDDPGWLVGKLFGAGVQQVGLQLLVLPLCLEIFRPRWLAIATSAAIFGIIHLPNPLLVGMTVLGSLGWCTFYLRSGRVVPVIASHVILAMVAGTACDNDYNMRVGSAALPLLPIELTAPDGSTLRVTALAVDGFVDHCEFLEEHVVCMGWAADVDRSELVGAILVLAAGSIHRFPAPSLPRPDVAAHFVEPVLSSSGFRLELPSEWFAEDQDIRIFAEGKQGRVSELHSFQDFPPRR